MAKKRITLSVLFILLSLLLVACEMDASVLESTFDCDDERCEITVSNTDKDDLEVSIEIWVENEGTPIGEKVQYPDTNAERHVEWYRNEHRLFYDHLVIPAGEIENFVVELQPTEGQALFRLHVRAEGGGFKSDGYYDVYEIVEFSDPDTYIENSLACDGTIKASTAVEADVSFGSLEMVIYLNDDMETPVAKYVVSAGESNGIEIPVPDGTWLIELDENQHQNPYIPEDTDTHKTRIYCEP
jgi:hypothetical protein